MSEESLQAPESSEDVLDLLLDQDEVDWNKVLRRLVREEDMNPWDIDIAVIAEKYLSLFNDMKQKDFRLSGKMVFAAAFFLKLKSDRLLNDDLDALDTMMMEPEELYEDLEEPEEPVPFEDVKPELVPHTPQPRKRKVSVQDLAAALEDALEKEQRNYLRRVKQKRRSVEDEPEVEAPETQRDIEEIIDDVYQKVVSYFKSVKRLTFDHLVSEKSKEEKVQTFIPLLHLDNQGKVTLKQEKPFDAIEVEDYDQ